MTTVSTNTAFGLCAAAGALGWTAISLSTGRREAWDAGIYFSVYLPALAVFVGAIAFFHPNRFWRWAFVPFGGQAAEALAQNPSERLLPLGLILFGIMGAFFVLPAQLGARAAPARARAAAAVRVR